MVPHGGGRATGDDTRIRELRDTDVLQNVGATAEPIIGEHWVYACALSSDPAGDRGTMRDPSYILTF